MRGKIGAGLIGLGYLTGAVFGLWALFLDAGVLLRLGGWLLLIAGLFLFPFAMTMAPLYAGFAWGDWHPLQVTVAGALMLWILVVVGFVVRGRKKVVGN